METLGTHISKCYTAGVRQGNNNNYSIKQKKILSRNNYIVYIINNVSQTKLVMFMQLRTQDIGQIRNSFFSTMGIDLAIRLIDSSKIVP